MSDHQANETNYHEKLNAQFGRSKSAEEEKELLREQIVDLRKVNLQLNVQQPLENSFVLNFSQFSELTWALLLCIYFVSLVCVNDTLNPWN